MWAAIYLQYDRFRCMNKNRLCKSLNISILFEIYLCYLQKESHFGGKGVKLCSSMKFDLWLHLKKTTNPQISLGLRIVFYHLPTVYLCRERGACKCSWISNSHMWRHRIYIGIRLSWATPQVCVSPPGALPSGKRYNQTIHVCRREGSHHNNFAGQKIKWFMEAYKFRGTL